LHIEKREGRVYDMKEESDLAAKIKVCRLIFSNN